LFYDERGAELFEQICTLDEYYLTRSELAILRAHAGDIAALAGSDCALIEYGSGAGIKVRLLLDALHRPAAYVPIDISREQLERVATQIACGLPLARRASRRRGLHAPAAAARSSAAALDASHFSRGRRSGISIPLKRRPSSPAYAASSARTARSCSGVDRRKSAAILDAAYDDRQGVTAEFNLNVLRRINRELGANFDLDKFEHVAFFNEAASRVEMHIKSLDRQCVNIAGVRIPFEKGETIWTESSYKYDEAMLSAVVGAAGFRVERLWTDPDENFWVGFLAAQ
jgi:uncharacterized SAM-dependent methyltransferase